MSTNEFSKILDAYISTAIDGIITITENGVIELVNESVAKMFGYEKDELIGCKVNVLMPMPDSSMHDQYIQRYHETKIPKVIGVGREVIGKKKDGTSFPIRIAVSEITIGERKLFTGVIHDLTEFNYINNRLQKVNTILEHLVEKRTNELEQVVNRLLKTNKELEEKEKSLAISLAKEKELNEMKSRFVSMASHEFRTPLSTIKSSASLIAKYNKEEDQAKREKHVQRINSSVNNLTGILHDFLTMSKLEEGLMQLTFCNLKPIDVVTEVVNHVEDILKSGQYITVIDQSEQQHIYVDRVIFTNILINLIINASKYSDKNQEIVCKLFVLDNYLHIKIIDQGIGIPLSEQPHIFSRFFRASNAETIQGTGLGLNIVRTYANELNGRISFISEEYKGSTFTLKIPTTNV